LHPFAQDVGSIVPDGFDAYARIFHPAWKFVDSEMTELRWSDIAERNGRTVHAEMQFHSIATPAPGRPHEPEAWDQDPQLGVVARTQAKALVALLARHTSTPDACSFCLWDGYGYLIGSVAAMTFRWAGVPRPNARDPAV